MTYPGDLDRSIADWLTQVTPGGLARETATMSAAYRRGATSSGLGLPAYLVARVPATFAANEKVHHALAAACPAFAPHSLLDIGTGPGTAAWAAVAQWPDLSKVTQCEHDADFGTLAKALNAASGLPQLQAATLLHVPEAALPVEIQADLVTASYVLAELPVTVMADVARRLWLRTTQVLVLIEPGTPHGFERLRVVRETLQGQGAFVVAPCTHQSTCPMSDGNWCHFKARVARSRAHMHAKKGTVPFEDEAFSYLVLSRTRPTQAGGRVIAPTTVNKVATVLPLCDADGLRDVNVASRNKPAYKRAKKIGWGDVWE